MQTPCKDAVRAPSAVGPPVRPSHPGCRAGHTLAGKSKAPSGRTTPGDEQDNQREHPYAAENSPQVSSTCTYPCNHANDANGGDEGSLCCSARHIVASCNDVTQGKG